jgi:RNA polymerase sigma factor (sigma-70 family)
VDGLESMTDEELLGRFLDRGDGGGEAAFRALVVRHGPMVLGVCRHVLHEVHDAEDAFQATFLVLARKGGTIRDRRVLSRWLYEVAYRIAVRARTHAVRRRTQERQGAEMSATAPEFDPEWTELRPILHEEVNRLPEKYRTPVVLCYLEGKTNEEVARLLDWPVGTVKGRLSRARDLLRSRLSRRGVAISAAFIGVFLSQKRLLADEVPTVLVDATVRNAMLVAKWQVAGTDGASTSPGPQANAPKPSRRLLRVVIASAVVIVVAYTLAGLTVLASSAPPEARPQVANYLLKMLTPSCGGEGGCNSKPVPTTGPGGTLPRRSSPLG